MLLNERQMSAFLKVYKKLRPPPTKTFSKLANRYFDQLNEFLLLAEKISGSDILRLVTKELLITTKIESMRKLRAIGSYYFIVPDIIRAVNGDPDQLIHMSKMLFMDEAVNMLMAKTPLNSTLKHLLSSPVFKGLIVYSIIELHRELAKELPCSERYGELQKQLIMQYITAGVSLVSVLYRPAAQWARSCP
ncbi:unnamed protein product [Bemisia tabaci]|uniref:Uncharacterized protein n=1 Tax=Bemisia tabaci TaxID=7038 RepID=A0A9P0F7M8_BEMTA|nr:unnamed protein product [Bemisia tabaci]